MKKGTVLSLKRIRLSEFIIKNNEILFILKARSICSDLPHQQISAILF